MTPGRIAFCPGLPGLAIFAVAGVPKLMLKHTGVDNNFVDNVNSLAWRGPPDLELTIPVWKFAQLSALL